LAFSNKNTPKFSHKNFPFESIRTNPECVLKNTTPNYFSWKKKSEL